MRWLLLALAACTTSHSLRVRAIDGTTGRPLSDEKLHVKTFLTSDACSHEERSKPFGLGHSEGTSSNRDIVNTTVKSGRDGWVSIEVIDEQGVCNYRATRVEINTRTGSHEIDPKAKGPIYIPVFFAHPKTNSGERTYVTHRAKAAFSPSEAVRSVYSERFLRVTNHEATTISATDGTVLVGATPEIHADSDGNDPFVRVALAKVTPSHDAWRVELTALDLEAAAPTYVVAPTFAAHGAQLATWAKAALDEVVLRAATAAKLIDRDYMSTNEFAIATKVDGARLTATIRHDQNPYDDGSPVTTIELHGTLARRDGRVVVENLVRR